MSTWRERLANGPRINGEVELITFDLAIRRLVVSYYAEFEGLLPVPAIEDGLHAAVRVYPVVLGHLVKNTADGSYTLQWDSRDTKQTTFGWYHRVVGSSSSSSTTRSDTHSQQQQQQQQQRVPSIYSTFQLWWDGALPDMRGRLAGAKVSVYPPANRSILVFSFSHALFDWPTGYNFMRTWLNAAIAAVAAPEKALPAAAAAAVEAPAFSRSSSTGSDSSATVDALVILDSSKIAPDLIHCGHKNITNLSLFSRECYRRPAATEAAGAGWNIPDTRRGCQQWLKNYNIAPAGPFAWDPLSRAGSCLMSWRLLLRCLSTERSVWRIPHHLLSTWKAAANSSCPLPEGMWYSAATAATALMAVTLFAVDQSKAVQHGGLYATQVVNIRGGRCGMDVPHETATNASVVGISVWVPLNLLQAAAAHLPITAASSSSSSSKCGFCCRNQPNPAAVAVPGPCPMLMRHIRMDLQRQLQDPNSYIAKQFEYYEVCGAAGLADEFLVGQPQREMAMGEVTVNNLTAAHGLPELPGVKLLNCSVCVLQDYGDRHVMSTPVPAADSSSSSSSSSGAKAHDLQLEICFPRRRCPELYQRWKQLGLQHIATPSQGLFSTTAAAAAAVVSQGSDPDLHLSSSSSSIVGRPYINWYFQPFDFFAHPVILKNFYVLGLAHLPWLFVEWMRVACQWFCSLLGL